MIMTADEKRLSQQLKICQDLVDKFDHRYREIDRLIREAHQRARCVSYYLPTDVIETHREFFLPVRAAGYSVEVGPGFVTPCRGDSISVRQTQEFIISW